MLRPVRDTLAAREWWRLEPCRDRLRVDGGACPLPTSEDLTPPQTAMVPRELAVVYIPRGNGDRKLEIVGFDGWASAARWVDLRSGAVISIARPFEGVVPARPDPRDEDWVLVIE
jgi:hypothetical protein